MMAAEPVRRAPLLRLRVKAWEAEEEEVVDEVEAEESRWASAPSRRSSDSPLRTEWLTDKRSNVRCCFSLRCFLH